MFVYISSLIAFYISRAHDRTTNENTATWQRLDWQTGWLTRKQRSGNTVSYLPFMQISPRASVRSREGEKPVDEELFFFFFFSFSFFFFSCGRCQGVSAVSNVLYLENSDAQAMCDLCRQMGRAVRDDSREGECSGPETERVEELCFVSLRPVFMSPSRSVSLRRYIVFSVCLYFNYYSLGLFGC